MTPPFRPSAGPHDHGSLPRIPAPVMIHAGRTGRRRPALSGVPPIAMPRGEWGILRVAPSVVATPHLVLAPPRVIFSQTEGGAPVNDVGGEHGLSILRAKLRYRDH